MKAVGSASVGWGRFCVGLFLLETKVLLLLLLLLLRLEATVVRKYWCRL